MGFPDYLYKKYLNYNDRLTVLSQFPHKVQDQIIIITVRRIGCNLLLCNNCLIRHISLFCTL